ncbi:MAG: tetratricopeptide repeat protein [Thiobacillus sp.]|nr:tetratricopeptide repeat protein [Thiobacillus sp.]MDP2056963.1 tetratricopeptide repeat protein [Thiobacillus sp.]
MSVINQMLRELDARGAASSDLPAASTGTVSANRHPAGLILGGLGLLAVGAAAIYWMLPAAPKKVDAPAATVIARQETAATPVAVVSAQVAPAIQNALQAVIAAPPAEPALAALVQPQVAMPVPEAVQAKAERPLSAAPKLLIPVQSADRIVAQVEPAVVKKMTELSPEADAQQYYDDAQTLRRAGKFDAAIGKYRQALERNPGMTNARTQLARLLQESGQADAALSLLKTGFEQRADGGLAIATGRLLADLGQKDEALGWLVRGQGGLRPADHALMGALLSQAYRHEEASRAYQRALAADPNQGGWLLGLGLALEAQGRVEEARMAYRNALERGQFKPEVIRFLRERSGLLAP